MKLAVGSTYASYRVFEPVELRDDCVERRYRFRSTEPRDVDERLVSQQFAQAELVEAS